MRWKNLKHTAVLFRLPLDLNGNIFHLMQRSPRAYGVAGTRHSQII